MSAQSGDAPPLALRIADAVLGLPADALVPEARAKAALCLLDLIGCAFEARALPWGRQACGLAQPLYSGGASVIGQPHAVGLADAAFANGVMAHGLVREDMHAPSISHLGMVVLPALLALTQAQRLRPVHGRELQAAVVAGYEVGAALGRAVIDSQLARVLRPTGITAPTAAAAAGARLLGLDAQRTASAIALAANSIVGLNQWAHTGGSEMYFHAGFAARNAVTAVLLAEQGAFGSPSVLDGASGLFAALGKAGAQARVALFAGPPEILAVYHKALPVCNFAQTPTQAALHIVREHALAPERIAAIDIHVPHASAVYPGCDSTGPFQHALQAKMSIQYCVAAALLLGTVTERNFSLLDDSALQRLLHCTRLHVDEALTQAYPGRQGGAVEVRDLEGAVYRARLTDVVHATESEIRARLRAAAEPVVGAARAAQIEAFIDCLAQQPDAAELARLLQPAAQR